MSEIYSRFTKSELGVMGWRSREMAHNMAESMKRNRAETTGRPVEDMVSDLHIQALEARMGGVANKAETATGEIDLGLLTGKEALQYMNALGIPMGAGRK